MWIFNGIQCCWIYMTRVLEESKTCFKSFQLITALLGFLIFFTLIIFCGDGMGLLSDIPWKSKVIPPWDEKSITFFFGPAWCTSCQQNMYSITKHERVLFNFWKSEQPPPVVSNPLFLVDFMFLCHLFCVGYAKNDSLTSQR